MLTHSQYSALDLKSLYTLHPLSGSPTVVCCERYSGAGVPVGVGGLNQINWSLRMCVTSITDVLCFRWYMDLVSVRLF